MPDFEFPPPDRQAYVHGFLDAQRTTVLHEAVREAVREVEPATLSREFQMFAPSSGLAVLQGTNVRDEMVFAVPSVLRVNPYVLGYYRLLLGVSQKQFYTTESGLNIFRSMEMRGVIGDAAELKIDEMCRELNLAIDLLLTAIPPGTLPDDVAQLPLITLGAQADGSWRNKIGEKATFEVYDALKAVIKASGFSFADAGTSLTVTNSSGREVTIALAPDPDVEIRERLNNKDYLRAAIEIKGGSDYANIHNRAGEAEKSHQKARGRGASEFWTVIACARADMKMLCAESPTTGHWFDIEQVRAAQGTDWNDLVSRVRLAMGI